MNSLPSAPPHTGAAARRTYRSDPDATGYGDDAGQLLLAGCRCSACRRRLHTSASIAMLVRDGADLVSSQTGQDRHAPALNLNFPAVAIASDDRNVTVWVDAPLRRRHLRTMLRRMHAAGLSPAPPSWTDLNRRARHSCYTRDQRHTLDTAGRDHILAAAGNLGGLGDSLELAVANANILAFPPGLSPTRPGPTMANPWPLQFCVPAHLLASAGHHHLYLDHGLDWTAYRRIVEAAGNAGLLGRAHVGATLARGASHLWLPWARPEHSVNTP